MTKGKKKCSNCKTELRQTARFCPECGAEQPEQKPAIFCSKCGTVEVSQENGVCAECKKEEVLTTVAMNSESPEVVSDENVSDKKPKSKLPIFIGVGTVLAIVAGGAYLTSALPAGDRITTQSSSPSSQPKPSLRIEDLGSAALLQEKAKSTCSALEEVILFKITYEEYTNRLSKLKNVSDEYEAYEFEPTVNWLGESQGDLYMSSLREQTKPSFDELLSGVEGISTYTIDEESLGNEYVKIAVAACGLNDSFTGTFDALKKLDAEVARVAALAASVPWYPKGYEEFSAEYATKHLGGESCSSDVGSCAIFNVVAIEPCSTLYIEVDFLSSEDKLLDTSFANINNVGSDKGKKVEIISIVEDTDVYEIKDISCSS